MKKDARLFILGFATYAALRISGYWFLALPQAQIRGSCIRQAWSEVSFSGMAIPPPNDEVERCSRTTALFRCSHGVVALPDGDGHLRSREQVSINGYFILPLAKAWSCQRLATDNGRVPVIRSVQ